MSPPSHPSTAEKLELEPFDCPSPCGHPHECPCPDTQSLLVKYGLPVPAPGTVAPARAPDAKNANAAAAAPAARALETPARAEAGDDGGPIVQLGAKPGKPGKWKNPHRQLPKIRWAVQLAYAAFIGLVGYEFYLFYAQIVWQVPITASRPPAVEAFLPISALLGLRRFALTGHWDDVHPAGLTILIAAIAGTFLARKVFCSWICPGGTASRILEWAASKTIYRRGRAFRLPRWAALPLLSLKYALLAFFVWTVFFAMPPFALEQFIYSPYNMSADVKMLLFFWELTGTAIAILLGLVVLSFVVKNFWCRFLCPYGALLGIVSLASPSRVVRDPATCNDCRACTRACPVEIPVHARGSVWTAECTGCLNCVAACTTADTLTVVRRGRRGLTPWMIPALGVGALLVCWGIARMTGHWETAMPLDLVIDLYRKADQFTH